MTVFDITRVFGSTLVAGAVNAVAGGGTFCTFSVRLLAGMSSIGANGL